MPPTTRASDRRAYGAPTPPRPSSYWQESQPPRRAPSTILWGTMGSSVIASSNQHTGITAYASARQVSAASQFAAADDSSHQAQASTVPRSPVPGGTTSLNTAVVPASQLVNTSTRESSQGASNVSQSVIVIDSSAPPPTPYPSLGRTMGPESSDGSGSSSSQPTSSSYPHPQSISSSQVRSAIANRMLNVPTSLWPNQAFTSPTPRAAIDSINARFSPILSSHPVSSPARRVLSETTRQENTASPKPEQITLTMNDTFNKNLNSPYPRNLVGCCKKVIHGLRPNFAIQCLWAVDIMKTRIMPFESSPSGPWTMMMNMITMERHELKEKFLLSHPPTVALMVINFSL